MVQWYLQCDRLPKRQERITDMARGRGRERREETACHWQCQSYSVYPCSCDRTYLVRPKKYYYTSKNSQSDNWQVQVNRKRSFKSSIMWVEKFFHYSVIACRQWCFVSEHCVLCLCPHCLSRSNWNDALTHRILWVNEWNEMKKRKKKANDVSPKVIALMRMEDKSDQLIYKCRMRVNSVTGFNFNILPLDTTWRETSCKVMCPL